jgi:nucleoside-diphosphate-sugar epimerase
MTYEKKCVGVIGATGAVGHYVLPLLVEEGWDVVAFSRKKRDEESIPGVRWRVLCSPEAPFDEKIEHWVSLAPITALSNYFPLLLSFGARRIVAVSSTSRFTKIASPDVQERRTAKSLAESEETLIAWAGKASVVYTILRPTMIYDFERDKNIMLIARFIDRFGLFDLNYSLAADYELMARFLEKFKIRAVYVPQIFVKMRQGGFLTRICRTSSSRTWKFIKP